MQMTVKMGRLRTVASVFSQSAVLVDAKVCSECTSDIWSLQGDLRQICKRKERAMLSAQANCIRRLKRCRNYLVAVAESSPCRTRLTCKVAGVQIKQAQARHETIRLIGGDQRARQGPSNWVVRKAQGNQVGEAVICAPACTPQPGHSWL